MVRQCEIHGGPDQGTDQRRDGQSQPVVANVVDVLAQLGQRGSVSHGRSFARTAGVPECRPAPRRAERSGRAALLRRRGPDPPRGARCSGRSSPARTPAARGSPAIAGVLHLGLGEEGLALHHEHLVWPQPVQERLQQSGVLAAAPVGVVSVVEALVAGLGRHPLDLAVQPGVLELEGPPERVLPLEAPRQLVLVGRVGALHRVAHHRDDPHLG